METSYLKVRLLGNRYSEWTPNLHSDRSPYWNLYARGSQGPQNVGGSTVVRRWPDTVFFFTFIMWTTEKTIGLTDKCSLSPYITVYKC